jgi:hypothetical protein
MSVRLEFIALGDQRIDGVPVRCAPLAEPNAGALYRRRLDAMRSSAAEYLCFIDGGSDACLPGFVDAMQDLADRGEPLGYAAELVHGKAHDRPAFSLQAFITDHSIIHHGVVCRREALLAIDWPAGCYSWEVIAYGTLAQQGFAHDPVPRYDWRPGRGGARLWPSYSRAIVNGKRWLQGMPGVHFPKDF